ncbi:hypothetical protein, partial [Alistipes shahii]
RRRRQHRPEAQRRRKNINNRIAALKRMKRTPSPSPREGRGGVRLVNGAEGGDNTARKRNDEEKT